MESESARSGNIGFACWNVRFHNFGLDCFLVGALLFLVQEMKRTRASGSCGHFDLSVCTAVRPISTRRDKYRLFETFDGCCNHDN